MLKLPKHLFYFVLIAGQVFAGEFYVATDGSDTNPGTLEQPFVTIQKAASRMVPGDRCIIRGGLYRETVRPLLSGLPGNPLRFEAFEDEKVFITGLDRIPSTKWRQHSGSIYQADMTSPGDVTQVFIDDQRMEIARFPNNTSENLMNPVWGIAGGAVAVNPPLLSRISDASLSTAPDFTNAKLWILAGRKWVAFSSRIESHNGSAISFLYSEATNDAYEPRAGSNYYVYGVLDCLDSDKEWFYDSDQERLYFQAPGGVNPAGLNVQARTRTWGFDLTGKDYIEIKNIHFFAAGVNMTGSNVCVIEGTRIYYSVPFFDADGWATTEYPQNSKYAAIKMTGRGCTVKNFEIAYSWGDGVVTAGNNHVVENGLIHDTNWICNDSAPIHTSGSGHVLRNNTIHRVARTGIVHRKSAALEIAFNEIFDCGLLTTDLGATYCYQTDGGGTVIHHNWVHDVVSKAHTAGIYLDNGSSNFLVHHNVVWNTDDHGIQTNLPASGHEIYNNTIWNCAQSMGGSGGELFDQTVYNNLSNSAAWMGTDVQQNLAVDDPGFVDAGSNDFRLRSDSPARDDYVLSPALLNGDFENDVSGWWASDCELFSVNDPVYSGSSAALVSERKHYWGGPRQNIAEVIRENGPGLYKISAWVKRSEGAAQAYLRFKLVDDSGESYPGTQKRMTAELWTEISISHRFVSTDILKEAWFELMTTESDIVDFYVDNCSITVPESSGSTQQRGGIFVAGINDDVTDGKVDAGAYEYGGSSADWRAGSSTEPMNPLLPTSEDSVSQPVSFALHQNFPNPFNPNTTIRFSLPNDSDIQLQVFDVSGRLVQTLFSGIHPAGDHTLQFEGSGLPSGIYVMKLSSNDSSVVRKMALIK